MLGAASRHNAVTDLTRFKSTVPLSGGVATMETINHSIVVFVIIDFPIIKLVFIAINYKLDIYSNYLSSIAKGNPYVESNFMQMINHSIVVFVIIDFPILIHLEWLT